MSMSKIEKLKTLLSNSDFRRRLAITIGGLLLLSGFLIVFLTYKDYASAYLEYAFSDKGKSEQRVELQRSSQEVIEEGKDAKESDVVFVDPTFGLYIPKIGANSRVIPNVNAYKVDEYTSALTKGVAHAKGTALPNGSGNIFMFAHSAVNFYEQRKFNVYFYLLHELEKNDSIFVSYDEKIYEYKVSEVKIVDPTDVKYLGRYENRNTLTLMTCWPAGFNYRRVIVIADRVEDTVK